MNSDGMNANIGDNNVNLGENGMSANIGDNSVSLGENGMSANLGGNTVDVGSNGLEVNVEMPLEAPEMNLGDLTMGNGRRLSVDEHGNYHGTCVLTADIEGGDETTEGEWVDCSAEL